MCFTPKVYSTDFVVLLFLNRDCEHSKNYLNTKHDKLKKRLDRINLMLQTIYSDYDVNDYFKKYRISYTPCLVVLNVKMKTMKIIEHDAENIVVENIQREIFEENIHQ